MHKTKTSILAGLAAIVARPVRALISIQKLKLQKPKVDVKMVRTVATVTVTLLSIAAVVKVSPAPPPHQVRTVLCQTVADYGGAYLSNFITADGEYFLLADGRLLFVKEE